MSARYLGALIADLNVQTDSAATDAATDVAALSTLGTLEIESIAYRSGDVTPGCLFFCIPGTKVDGHEFAAEAAGRGAVALAVQHEVPIDLPQIQFEDTRLALALVSRNFYGDPSADLAITAVTGTNGKTTTTYLVDWICRYHLARSRGISVEETQALTGLIGTVETRIGTAKQTSKYTTPESLDLQRLLSDMREGGVSHVCMEASSHAIALKRVSGVHFAVAAFTNLSQDHLDFHKTMEQYYEAKAALFDSPLVGSRVINIDTEAGRRLVTRCHNNGFEALTCGFAEDAQIRACNARYDESSTTLEILCPEGRFTLTYPLIGGFNASNIVLAASIGCALGIPLVDIVDALAECPQIPGRLERVYAAGIAPHDKKQPPVGVFVDYSHTPDSIKKALEALNELKTRNTIIVFGCGGDRDATKRPLMGAAALAADYAIVTSDNPRTEDPLKIIDDILPGMTGACADVSVGDGADASACAGARAADADADACTGDDATSRFEVEPDRRAAIAKALARAEAGDLVLIAGKGHEDYQLVGNQVLSFDDRIVAAEELAALAANDHWGADAESAAPTALAANNHWGAAAEQAAPNIRAANNHEYTTVESTVLTDLAANAHGSAPCS